MAKKAKALDRADLEHLGESIITVKGADNVCLWHLTDFKNHGVYDPNFGRVPVLPEEAEVHNRALCKAQVEGLDNNCEVGMWGTFYLTEKSGRKVVSTFLGDVVSDNMTVSGRVTMFRRNGKMFRGRTPTRDDLFKFRRVK